MPFTGHHVPPHFCHSENEINVHPFPHITFKNNIFSLQAARALSVVSSQGRGNVDSNMSNFSYFSFWFSSCGVCSHLLTSLAAGGKLKGLSASMIDGKLGGNGCGKLGFSTGLLLQRWQAVHINKRGTIPRKMTWMLNVS